MGPGYGPTTLGPRGWTGYAPFYGEHHHHHGHPLAWVIFALLLLVLLLVIANLVATLQRKRRGPWPGRPMGPAVADGGPEAVLRMRYARGEMSRKEFLQASADLAASGLPAPADG
jgi:uncharacterized membrane protein